MISRLIRFETLDGTFRIIEIHSIPLELVNDALRRLYPRLCNLITRQ